MASPSTPSSQRAVLGIRNTDETCWNLVGTGREVCCTQGTRGSSFPYLAMRTLGHLMFPFAHSPSASGGWTVRWCGVLRTRGCVSCNEDVVVGWLHAPCIKRSDMHPLVATRFPGREITFPVLPTYQKASSCACKECFRLSFHHALEVSEDPEVTHVVRHVLAS